MRNRRLPCTTPEGYRKALAGRKALGLTFIKFDIRPSLYADTPGGLAGQPTIGEFDLGRRGRAPGSGPGARLTDRGIAAAIIAMAPARTDQTVAMEMFRRMADAFDEPIILQNAAAYAPLTGEQVATLVEEVPQIEYVKEERPPGPKHIAEVHALAGDKIKTIFGGAAGKFLPDELRRGADGCMPACEIADLPAKVMDLRWAGEDAGARVLHTRLLPLINLETHPFMRYILKRRSVFTSTVERAPAGPFAQDAADKREISTLIQAIEDVVDVYPFGPE